MSLSSLQFKKFALALAERAEDKKAEDILLLDMRGVFAGLCDYMVIVSANSDVHMMALGDAIEETADRMGFLRARKDGWGSRQWSVLDYGGVLVHIFHYEARGFYTIERLWENAKKIKWTEPAARAIETAKKKSGGRKK